MKYECHFPNQHQKLYHISKAQLNTFSYRHPIFLSFQLSLLLFQNYRFANCKHKDSFFVGEETIELLF